MSVSPDVREDSPEPPMSALCKNLETQFINMQDLSSAEGMHVYARVRPMLNSEIEAGYKVYLLHLLMLIKSFCSKKFIMYVDKNNLFHLIVCIYCIKF